MSTNFKTYIWNTEYEVIIVNADTEEFARTLALNKYQLQISDARIRNRYEERKGEVIEITEIIDSERKHPIDFSKDYTYNKILKCLEFPPHFILEGNSNALIYTHANQ